MFVLPSARGALPPAFALRRLPARPLELSPDEIGRNRDRWIDEWTESSCAEARPRRDAVARPAAFLALFFAFPLATILERGLGRRRPPTPSSARRRRCGCLVHHLAGGRLDRAHAAPGAPARLGHRPVRLPRPLAHARARAGAVRAPDGRRRDGIPRAPARQATSAASRRSSPPTSSSTSPSSRASSAAPGRRLDPRASGRRRRRSAQVRRRGCAR